MNSKYWDNEGARKTFTHELFNDWVINIPLDTKILDYGCGYGRISKKLYDLGFKNILGYDQSDIMLSRAIAENPGPRYTSQMDVVSESKYGLVLCFALFTSCPKPYVQEQIKRIIEQQTQQESYLYISDYLIENNPHYYENYNQKQLGIYGCFGNEQTVIFRHHENNHFSKMFSGWKKIKSRSITGKTLNGNSINMKQLLYKRLTSQSTRTR